MIWMFQLVWFSLLLLGVCVGVFVLLQRLVPIGPAGFLLLLIIYASFFQVSIPRADIEAMVVIAFIEVALSVFLLRTRWATVFYVALILNVILLVKCIELGSSS